MEKGRRPPLAGWMALKSWEREPSAAMSQTAKIPGVGGIPLTDAMSCVLSSLKITWLTEPAGPFAGL
jgi:hypothetical protein